MGEITGIEWTHATFNPWIGCTAVSGACDHCYAKTLVERWGDDFAVRKRTSEANWKKPLAWNRKAEKSGKPFRVFCASLADVFDNQVPEVWRADLWAMIRVTPHLTWQLLTKRPQNIAKMLPADWGDGYPNVWLGTTTENTVEFYRRWKHLAVIPARIHFISYEPALSEIRRLAYNGLPLPDWVICGGESGRGARPMNPAWARNMRDNCTTFGIPFFFKQWGEWGDYPQIGAGGWSFTHQTGAARFGRLNRTAFEDGDLLFGGASFETRYPWHVDNDPGPCMVRVGKKAAGSLLDGPRAQGVSGVSAALSYTQDQALYSLAGCRRVTDDGWIFGGLPEGVSHATARALQDRGMIERKFPPLGACATIDVQWRITPAGRSYMANPK